MSSKSIKPSSTLRNDYNKVSSYCRETGEAVHITLNGSSDTVIISEEKYNEFLEQKMLLDLYETLGFDVSEKLLEAEKEHLLDTPKKELGSLLDELNKYLEE